MVRLKPADPFELIRWLARSQSDPRKAVAELVQNALDARATSILITRRRVRGSVVLIIADNGEGVIPEMTREDALHYLATHVGHSRKMGLTPQERAQRVIAGQYGIGLLGFWAIGKHLELQSRVNGSTTFALRLTEDSPKAAIVSLPTPLDAEATFTQLMITHVHASALRALGGRRLAEYLAAELRGQLLAHAVSLQIDDRLQRGAAQRRFSVVPKRFVGEALRVPAQLDVEGYRPLRVELYAAPPGAGARLEVAASGTLVADDIAELSALGLDDAPWTGCGLAGLIDFPSFNVPPGSRRGVIPDSAAAAFVAVMERLQPMVNAELERLHVERASATNRELVTELRRALRGFARLHPQYALPSVRQPDGEGGDGDQDAALSGGTALDDRVASASGASVHAELFAPGPLRSLVLQPERVEVAPNHERRVRAVPLDADGRVITRPIDLTWSVVGDVLQIVGGGRRPAVLATATARPGTQGTLRVTARDTHNVASADAAVVVVDPSEREHGDSGIPEPELVSDAGALWRSRLVGNLWQVNEAHEDYIALRADRRARMRYLLALFAKEIVHRSYGKPGDEPLLEHMVEVLAHAERNLSGGKGSED